MKRNRYIAEGILLLAALIVVAIVYPSFFGFEKEKSTLSKFNEIFPNQTYPRREIKRPEPPGYDEIVFGEDVDQYAKDYR